MEHSKILETLKHFHESTDDNVIGVTYGYKTVNGELTDEQSIIFTVKEKKPKEQLTKNQLLPKEIVVDNKVIPTDVIQGSYKLLGISDCDAAFYTWRSTPPTNRDEQRPLDCGISIANWDNAGLQKIEGIWYPMNAFTGTMGLLAIDNENGSLVGVTNNHVIVYDAFICLDRSDAGGDVSMVNNVKGNNVTQPNESGTYGLSYSIGHVKRYYPIRELVYNEIDTALLTIDAEADINYSTSFHQHLLTASSYPWATTFEIESLLVGDSHLLYSSGRTTGAKGEGTTKLRFSGYSVINNLHYNRQGAYVDVSFLDCITFIATTTAAGPYTDTCYDPISGGDSGSALIADFSGTKKVIGLVFAGMQDYTEKTISGVACRMDRIADLLNISEWNGEAVEYSDVANTMEITRDGLSNSEYIDEGGHRYWQVGLRYKTV
jgi:hypothetical protein